MTATEAVGAKQTEAVRGLRWLIKRSFLQYVARTSDGQCSTTDGASVVNDNVFLFESNSATVSPGNAAVRASFTGDVRFSGHHGFMFVRIADPQIEVTDGIGSLSVIDYLTPEADSRRDLVTFKAQLIESNDEPLAVLVGTDVRLTIEGAELFNDVYPPGEPFEDLEAQLIHPTSLSKDNHD